MTEHNNFKTNLNWLMNKHQLTSVKLAEEIGVSAESIRKLRSGELGNPTLKIICLLTHYFNVSIDSFIFKLLGNQSKKALAIENEFAIPYVTWEHINDWGNSETIIHANAFGTNDNMFAIYLTENYGCFEKDSYVFIKTDLDPLFSDYALIYNRKMKTYSIKKLLIEDTYYLQSILMEKITIEEFNDDYQIIGILVGTNKINFFRHSRGKNDTSFLLSNHNSIIR